MVPETVMVPRQFEEPAMEIQRETVMREKTRMVPRTIMVEERYEEPEIVERQVPKMVERVVEETVMVPETRQRTVMVPQVVDETVMVPRTVPRTVVEQAMTTRTEMVPETVMKPQCVQDYYEETRTLRFDPISGQQIGDISHGYTSPRGPTQYAPVTHGSPGRAPVGGSFKSPRQASYMRGGPMLQIGQRVRARYLDGNIYDATIVAHMPDDNYSVQWYDGSFSETVPHEHCRPATGAGSPPFTG